jgi:zinc D-Ala-D-Ala carboxypeptidase
MGMNGVTRGLAAVSLAMGCLAVGTVVAASANTTTPTTLPTRQNVVRAPSGAVVQVSPSRTCSQGGPLLRRGHRGPAVKELQHLLTERGLDTRQDGAFGPWTEYQVKQYQAASRWLAVDGRVGNCTWSALRAG